MKPCKVRATYQSFLTIVMDVYVRPMVMQLVEQMQTFVMCKYYFIFLLKSGLPIFIKVRKGKLNYFFQIVMDVYAKLMEI